MSSSPYIMYGFRICRGRSAGFRRSGRNSLDMDVVVDVVDAVAVVAVALGAIAELQIRIVRVGAAADRAFVTVGPLSALGLIIAGPVGSWAGRCRAARARTIAAAEGKNVPDVAAEKQEVVEQRKDREEPGEIRDAAYHDGLDDLKSGKAQIYPRQILHLDRDDEEQQHLRLGRDGRDGEEEAEIQVGRTGLHAEEQPGQVRQKDTAEIVEVELKRTPVLLQDLAELVVAEQRNRGEQQIDAARIEQVGENIGEQPPHLSFENRAAVKLQPGIDDAAGIDD